MSIERVKEIADAVLFEGYILYPYRQSAIKNQQRWTFGGVFPSAYDGDEPALMQTETLLNARASADLPIFSKTATSASAGVRLFVLGKTTSLKRSFTIFKLCFGVSCQALL